MHAFSTMRSLAAASLIVCPALLGTLPAVHAQVMAALAEAR